MLEYNTDQLNLWIWECEASLAVSKTLQVVPMYNEDRELLPKAKIFPSRGDYSPSYKREKHSGFVNFHKLLSIHNRFPIFHDSPFFASFRVVGTSRRVKQTSASCLDPTALQLFCFLSTSITFSFIWNFHLSLSDYLFSTRFFST